MEGSGLASSAFLVSSVDAPAANCARIPPGESRSGGVHLEVVGATDYLIVDPESPKAYWR